MDHESCLLCGSSGEQGLRIFSAFICQTCETKLINTSPADERYRDYVQKVKKVWTACGTESNSQ